MLPLILAGLSVAVVHALLPNHWLPFTLAGRAQGWSRGHTLSIAAIAVGTHVLLTSLLGLFIVWVGLELSSRVESLTIPLTAVVLIALGLAYILLSLRRHPHHPHTHADRPLSDRAAVVSLIAMLTFSPCEAFLPVYLSAIPYGWSAFLILSLVLALGTFGGTLLLVGLSSAGMEHLHCPLLERHERTIVGTILTLLGVSVFLFGH